MSQAWIDNPIRGLLLDISGVLKNGDIPIEGSIEAIDTLNRLGLPYRLVTNETQSSKRLLFKHLNEMGFHISSPDLIISPAPYMAKHLEAEALRPYLLVHPNVLEDFDCVSQSEPNCVVVGDAGEYFSYNVLNKAFKLLMDGHGFFTLGKGKYYKEGDSLLLDVGSFTAALEFASGVSPSVFGKPSLTFFEHALRSINIPRNMVVMIGDDVTGDVGGAQNAGIRGILVKTGKYREGDESKHGITPDGVVDNLKEALSAFVRENSS